MLVIRQPQLEVLADARREGFVVRLIEHFTRFYPREVRLAGDGMRDFVHLGIRRAMAHGCSAQREASLFINLMIMLGADFEHDPQVPWAAQQLRDRTTPPFRRLQGVHRSAVRYLEQTAGNENEHIARAMVRIRGFSLRDAPDIGSDGFVGQLAGVLRRLYPQKVGVQGEPAMRQLVQLAIETARRHGVVGGQGVTLFAGLMLMLGSGFATDPMYGWSARVLADKNLVGEETRVTALHREAIAYLVASLSPT